MSLSVFQPFPIYIVFKIWIGKAPTREIMRTLWFEDVGLNLPEFKWLMSCSIITDYYVLQSLKALFFSYLEAAGVGGQAWLLITFNVLDIL